MKPRLTTVSGRSKVEVEKAQRLQTDAIDAVHSIVIKSIINLMTFVHENDHLHMKTHNYTVNHCKTRVT